MMRGRWARAARAVVAARAGWALAVAVLSLTALAYGCGQMSADSCADTLTCAFDGSVSDQFSSPAVDGGGGAPADASCDPTQDPSAEPCLVADPYGIFVSPTGVDSPDGGTLEHPVRTIHQGIANAAALADAGSSSSSRVFICQGTYNEQVAIDEASDGIGLYGGFDCTTWAYVASDAGGPIVTVQGPSPLYALTISGTSQGIAIEDVAFTVPGAGPAAADGGVGGSSIAAFVSQAAGEVKFLRDAFVAGDGSNGADAGAPPSNWFSSDLDASAGNPPDGAAGGAPQVCPCPQWGESAGGAGGNGGNPADDGGPGSATPEAVEEGGFNGAGGGGVDSLAAVFSCGGGILGANGAAEADGGSGAGAFGVLSASGWAPAAGSPGAPGNPGQGGGGGGGDFKIGGGGGGCGGCGGAGGLPGPGGGSSIALLVFDSVVSVTQSALVAGTAGNGGTGGAGENGSAGGVGGGVGGACTGGNGGGGAGGQGGGGGAGGISVGILYEGTMPSVDPATTFTSGAPGTGGGAGGGGAGGAGGIADAPDGSAGAAGIDGTPSQFELSL